MKKILCLFFAAILSVGLTACAQQQSAPRRVMLILQSWSSSFAEEVTRGANAAANEYGLVLTVKNVPVPDAAKQQAELIQSATEQGFDAVIVDPADTEIVGKAAGDAQKRGASVISLGSGVQTGQTCTVDIDISQMATGTLLVAQGLVGPDASVLILNCQDEHDNTQRLADALQTKLKEFPDIKCAQIDFHIGENMQMTDSFNQFTASGRGNFAVIALNAYATVFAGNQLKIPHPGRKTALISFSHDKNAISLLEQRRVDAICMNRNMNVGFTAVEKANRAADGEETVNELIPSVFVNLQNLYSSEIQEILFPLS